MIMNNFNEKKQTMERKFTLEDALKIQKEQLDRWSFVLNDIAYRCLLDECEIRNRQGYKSPFNVFRGDEMSYFIMNLSITLHRENIKL